MLSMFCHPAVLTDAAIDLRYGRESALRLPRRLDSDFECKIKSTTNRAGLLVKNFPETWCWCLKYGMTLAIMS